MSFGPVGHRLEHREAVAARRAVVGVDVDGDGRVRVVQDPRAPVHARPEAVVILPRHDDPGTVLDQVRAQVCRDVEVEPGLGVAAGGLGPGRVAVFPLAAVPDLLVEEPRVGVVAAVVAGVDADDLARERLGRDRAGCGPGACGSGRGAAGGGSGSTAAIVTRAVRVRRAPMPDAERAICISPHSASEITVARGFDRLPEGQIPALRGRSRQPQHLAGAKRVRVRPDDVAARDERSQDITRSTQSQLIVKESSP